MLSVQWPFSILSLYLETRASFPLSAKKKTSKLKKKKKTMLYWFGNERCKGVIVNSVVFMSLRCCQNVGLSQLFSPELWVRAIIRPKRHTQWLPRQEAVSQTDIKSKIKTESIAKIWVGNLKVHFEEIGVGLQRKTICLLARARWRSYSQEFHRVNRRFHTQVHLMQIR